MNHVLAVAGRELRSFFTTPISYALLTAYSIVSGFFFFVALQGFLFREMQAQAREVDRRRVEIEAHSGNASWP